MSSFSISFKIIIFNLLVIVYAKDSSNTTLPNILICTLVRNKAHTLPYFLSYLENLDYPKDHLALWIRSDHNQDNSVEVLNKWLNRTAKLYHHVDNQAQDDPKLYENASSLWPRERFELLIRLKEEALNTAREYWADFIFFLDADIFLTNRNTLQELIAYKKAVIAPMLISVSDYSNFWTAMDQKYYFEFSTEYTHIYKENEIGNFVVPMVHSAVLIDVREPITKWLTFSLEKLHENQKNYEHFSQQYDGPYDDIIIFAMSAKYFDIPLYVSNMHRYGFIMEPLEGNESFSYDIWNLENTRVQIIHELEEAPLLNKEFEEFVQYPEPSKLSFDHIYMINLKRRPERRHKMELLFKEMGLIVERVDAIDGRDFQLTQLDDMGIRVLENYEDPMQYRKLKLGEIACFLSHYKIWQRMIELGQKEVLIFEDDIRFMPFFRINAFNLADQARKTATWDLLYFGRKGLDTKNEVWADESKTLVYPKWTYWTVSYALTLECAKKLIAARPLQKILPVDEFLPIMFDQHPNDTWKSHFENRNLIALSAYPTILQPQYFIGDEKYITDTEDSIMIDGVDEKVYEKWNALRDEL